MLFGAGVVAMVRSFGTGVPGEIVNGGYTNITIGWGLAVTMGIYVSGKISGAHLNPAVTVALARFRGFAWRKVVALHRSAGSGRVSAHRRWSSGTTFRRSRRSTRSCDHTAGIFTTFPAFPQMPSAGFLDQVIGTALLLFMIFAISDERNLPIGNLGPILVGLVVVAIGMSFGGMHGYAINPARDFGPRLFTAVAGFKNNGLTDGTLVFWVPIAGPLVGGLIGAAVYDFGIRRWLQARDESLASNSISARLTRSCRAG